MDKIIEKMIDFLPLWYVISIALIAIIMKFYYARFKPLEDKTIHADCINKNGKIDRLVTDVDKLKEDVSDIKEDISAIKAVLIQKFPNAAAVFSMKKSPRKLNELGEELFKRINGTKFLETHKDFFFSKIDGMKPKTALDVENAANFACAGFTDNEIFNGIKNFVYNAPSITIKNEQGEDKLYDITLGDVSFVLSLPLRDLYLEAHPELLSTETDLQYI